MKKNSISNKLDSLNESILYYKLVNLTNNSKHNRQILDWFIDGGELLVSMIWEPYYFSFSIQKENVIMSNIFNIRHDAIITDALNNIDEFNKIGVRSLTYFIKRNSKIKYINSYYDNHYGIPEYSEGWEHVKSHQHRKKKLNKLLEEIKKNVPDWNDYVITSSKTNTAKTFFNI